MRAAMIRCRLLWTPLALPWLVSACGGHADAAAAAAPPPAIVEHENAGGSFHVERPDRFPLVAAVTHRATTTLSVTGVVSPDVSRAVPVVSLTSGRVVDIRVRLGDTVRKGDLLLRVLSADATSALADYRKAGADDALARAQLERARDLFEHDAIARKDLEVAEDASDKASVDLQNTAERLRVLGVKPAGSVTEGSIVDVVAPASGVITEQNVTPAAGIKTLDNSPNLFTISDLSRVWILCDVNENDLAAVRAGDAAEIHAVAYPERVLTGRVSNIGAVLDPALRAAKVRVELPNPGLLRVGMFVTAEFHGESKADHVAVPRAAVLHLHDRNWVYVSTGAGAFERREVAIGPSLPGDLLDIVSGLTAGQRVAANALELQTTVEQ